jgi:hypothetical protein
VSNAFVLPLAFTARDAAPGRQSWGTLLWEAGNWLFCLLSQCFLLLLVAEGNRYVSLCPRGWFGIELLRRVLGHLSCIVASTVFPFLQKQIPLPHHTHTHPSQTAFSFFAKSKKELSVVEFHRLMF